MSTATEFLRRLSTWVLSVLTSANSQTGLSNSSTASTNTSPSSLTPSKHYLSVGEIVDDIYGKIDEGSHAELVKIDDERELFGFHHTTGRYIRNHYKLWDDANPYTMDVHPDDLSMAIITLVWKRVRAEDKETKSN